MATCRIQRTALNTIASAIIVTSDGQMISVKPNSREALLLSHYCPHDTGTVTIDDDIVAGIIASDDTDIGHMLAVQLGLGHITQRPYDRLLVTWNKNDPTLIPQLERISQRGSITIYNTERHTTESISGTTALDIALRTISNYSRTRSQKDIDNALQHAIALLTNNKKGNVILKTPDDTMAYIFKPLYWTTKNIDQQLRQLDHIHYTRGTSTTPIPCDLAGQAVPSTTVVL